MSPPTHLLPLPGGFLRLGAAGRRRGAAGTIVLAVVERRLWVGGDEQLLDVTLRGHAVTRGGGGEMG